MEYVIKNMVCRHCVAAVEAALQKAGIQDAKVFIGRVELDSEPTEEQLESLDAELAKGGFERASTRDEMLIEKTKSAVLEHVRSEAECRLKLSACIEKQVGLPFDYLSRLFSRTEGRTLEQFHIAQKVERVKELIAYGQYTLAEIADITGYSSAPHMSRQFKTVTGMTPTQYIENLPDRESLEKI